jgi:hypothetical protein
MPQPTAERRLSDILSPFTPEIAERAAAAIARLRDLLPTANVMVYDNYNAVAAGFTPNDRPSDAIVSIAVYPKTVSLCFLKNGPRLPDPAGLLNGSGTRVRHLRLREASMLDDPSVRALMDAALAMADPPLPASPPGTMVIKSVSATRCPRRPAG